MKTCSRSEGGKEERRYSGERGVQIPLSCEYGFGGTGRRGSTRDWKEPWYQITSLRGGSLTVQFATRLAGCRVSIFCFFHLFPR